MMNSGIYKITNTNTGMFYVGRTVNWKRRESEHRKSLIKGCHHNPRLQNSWDSHGEDAFSFSLIWPELAEFQPELEQLFLDEFMPTGVLFNAHNLSEGGSYGMTFPNSPRSVASKARVFAAMDWAVENVSSRDAALLKFGCSWDAFKKYLPEWEAKNGKLSLPLRASGANSGMYKHGLSKEIRRRRIADERLEGNLQRSIKATGPNNGMHGRRHTDAAKAIQSAAAREQAERNRNNGHVVSEDTRRKVSAALRGKEKSVSHKQNHAFAQLGKRYLTPAGVFCTSKECEEATGVKAATVMWRCKNNYQGNWSYT